LGQNLELFDCNQLSAISFQLRTQNSKFFDCKTARQQDRMTVFSPQFQPAVDLIYGILKQVQNDTLRQAKGKLKTQNFLTARLQNSMTAWLHDNTTTVKSDKRYDLSKLL